MTIDEAYDHVEQIVEGNLKTVQYCFEDKVAKEHINKTIEARGLIKKAVDFYTAMAPEEGQGFFKTIPKLSDSLRYLGEYPCNEGLHPIKYEEGLQAYSTSYKESIT